LQRRLQKETPNKAKKKCERKVAELHDEALFKDPPPPDECPICYLILPNEEQTTFQTCCGKIICNGCMIVMVKETRAKGKPGLCPFCRKPTSTSEKEEMKRLMKLVDSGHSQAIYNYACYIRGGDRQDWVTANRLYLKAGELGCAGAYYNLGGSYDQGRGVDVDEKKAKHYYELAAISGGIDVHNVLGGLEAQAGNYIRAMKHFIIAVKSGNNRCLGHLKVGYKSRIITKDEYEEALRSFQQRQQRQQETKSDERDQAGAARISERATFGSAFRRTEDHE